MAFSQIIGSLRVSLGLDTAQFQTGAKSAQSTLGSLTNSFKSFAAGAIAALSFGALTKVLTSTIDKMDEMSKASEKIGIPIEALEKLSFSAKLSDVSIEQLQVGVGKLSKAMEAIAGGKGGTPGAALQAIGVAAVDASGKLRPTEAVIADVAEKFAKMKDGAGKTALAIALFGKAGAQLIPLLNQGRQGLQENADEAQRLGLVYSKEAGQAAEKFNDNLTRLEQAGQGLVTQLVVYLIPTITDLTDSIVNFVETADMKSWFAGLEPYIETSIKEFNALAGILDRVQKLSSDVTTAIPDAGRAVSQSEIDGAFTTSGDGKSNREAVKVKAKKVLNDAPNFTSIEVGAAKAEAALKKLEAEQKRQVEGFRRGTTDLSQYLRGLEQETQLLGLNDGAVARATESQRIYNSLEDAGIKLSAAQRLELEAKLNQIPALVNGVELQRDALASLQEIGQTFENAFSTAFQSIADGTESVLGAFKKMTLGILSSITTMFANKFFKQLIEGGPTAGGSGGIIGALFKSFSSYKFASGGTILPGGAGGIDSQFVQFHKSPNERVDITKPGQSLGSSQPNIDVHVENHSSARVETRRDSNGNPLIVLRDAMAGLISTGQLDPSLSGRGNFQPNRITR